MKFSRQTTLRSQATVTGVGVHSGLPVSLTLGPAPVDAGFIFVRTGLDGCDREVSATADSVIATEFATVLGDRDGPLVSTAEHVLAALRGMGVDNAIIEVDGPEVPIMDGSAVAFVAAIDQAGIVTQSASRRFIQVLKPVQVTMGDSFGEIRPHAAGFRARIVVQNQPVYQTMALVARALLQEIGITLDVDAQDAGSFFSAGKGDAGKALDMFIIRFNGKLDPNFLAQWFTTAQIGVWNWQRWSNPEFDALLDQASAELDDAKRTALFIRAQQIMEDGAAFVWLTYDVSTFIYQSWLKPALLPSGIDWALDRFAPA